MPLIHDDLTQLIGNTPMLRLYRVERAWGLDARILAKIEYLSPAGSIKDRTAWGIIRTAECEGHLRSGQLLVDITSGNTGIGLAAVAAARGYRTKFYLRNIISDDKIKILRQYGAEVVLVDSADFVGPGAVDAIMERIRLENPGAYLTDQRGNPANPRIHWETTGPEIWRDTGGAVDVLVAAVGTGGTIAGAGGFLKSRKPDVQVIVAEPTPDSLPSADNPYAENIEGMHRVSDVDPGQLPDNYAASVVDDVIAVNLAQARQGAALLARAEGLLAGHSGGAVLQVARQVALRSTGAGKTIVIVIPDSGERYLSDPITSAPEPGAG